MPSSLQRDARTKRRVSLTPHSLQSASTATVRSAWLIVMRQRLTVRIAISRKGARCGAACIDGRQAFPRDVIFPSRHRRRAMMRARAPPIWALALRSSNPVEE
jgi:hypothetical protein